MIILVALLLQRSRGTTGRDEKGTWAVHPCVAPAARGAPEVFLVRNLRWIVVVALFGCRARSLPLVISNSERGDRHASSMGFDVVGLSVGIVTGLGGQLSLGQFAARAASAASSRTRSPTCTGTFVLGFILYGGLGRGGRRRC